MSLVPALIVAAVVFSGCGSWTVEPEEDVFFGNESVSSTVTVNGPGEFKILGQSISGAESHFKLESECAGKTLKPKEKESLFCGFKVAGENFKGGSEAKLFTEVEDLGTKAVGVRCVPLVMAGGGGNLSANVVLRPQGVAAGPGGRCFPFDYGQKLAKNSVNPQKFKFNALNGEGEFEIVETAPGLGAAFTLINNGCTAGFIVKGGTPCTFEIRLTTNGVANEEFETTLKLKFKVVGEATVYEKSGVIKGKNAP